MKTFENLEKQQMETVGAQAFFKSHCFSMNTYENL